MWSQRTILTSLTAVSSSLALLGCNSLLPGINVNHTVLMPKHPESLDIEGENVTVRLIAFDDPDASKYVADWDVAFQDVFPGHFTAARRAEYSLSGGRGQRSV